MWMGWIFRQDTAGKRYNVQDSDESILDSGNDDNIKVLFVTQWTW